MSVALLGRQQGALRKRLAAVESLLSEEVRYVSMRMEFRTHAYQDKEGVCETCGKGEHGQRILLSAGGVWDRRRRAFREGSPPSVLREQDVAALSDEERGALGLAHVLIVNDSQVEYVEAFAAWLYAFRNDLPRPTALDVLAGRRRGGKTYIMIACVLAAALASPVAWRQGKAREFVGWIVVASYPEQREVHEDMQGVLAPEEGAALDARTWVRRRPMPHNCYVLPTGATIYLKSANNPESLKQGRVDVIGLNELQKMDGDAVVHAAGNAIDLGGLVLGSSNAPRKAKAAYMLDLLAAWTEGRTIDPEDGQPVVRWYWVDPEKNPHVNRPARRKYKILAGLINPKLAAADADNEWNQISDVVMPKWNAKLILESVPSIWDNCTGEVIQAMRLREYLRPPGTYTSFGGLDFNKYPWMAAVRLRAYRDPTRCGALCLVIEQELRNDPQGDKGRTEKEFIIDLHRAGWDPAEVLFIGDPSGQWQSSEHRKKGGVKQGHSSFDFFRTPTEYHDDERGAVVVQPWDVFAPTTWKAKDSKHYAHPRIVESVDDCNELMRSFRLFVLASCPHVIEAFKKCERGKNAGPFGDYAHIVDAVRYPIHRALNAMDPKKPRRTGGGGTTQRGARPMASGGFGGGGRSGGGRMFGG